MEHLGNLTVTLFLLNPAHEGQHPDNVFARRMRRVTLLRMYQVSKEEAAKTAAMFLYENKLDNRDYYQTEVVWTVTEYL